MKTVTMRQCMLQNGSRRLTAWIPEEFSVKGKVLALEEGNFFEDGWEVVGVSDVKKSWIEVNARSQDYKKTRQATDI